MPLSQERTYTIDDNYALPDSKRAELIDGQIYYMAPGFLLNSPAGDKTR